MQLPHGEPAYGPWTDRSFEEVAERLGMIPVSRGILAVDGRSGSGKTTFAAGLANALPGSTVVHTDDVAWHHSFFGWAELMLDGVVKPFLAGEDVVYRPPAWEVRDREGAIEVPGGASWLVIEGVGAARGELDEFLDVIVWVQCDFAVAERRGIERDGGDQAAIDFWHEWMASEIPFLAEQRPWDRADAIVNGSPEEPPSRGAWVTSPIATE